MRQITARLRSFPAGAGCETPRTRGRAGVARAIARPLRDLDDQLMLRWYTNPSKSDMATLYGIRSSLPSDGLAPSVRCVAVTHR